MKYIFLLVFIPSIAFADGMSDFLKMLQEHPEVLLQPDVSQNIIFPRNVNRPTEQTITIQPNRFMLREQIISERVGAPTGNVFQDGIARGLHGAMVDYDLKHGR